MSDRLRPFVFAPLAAAALGVASLALPPAARAEVQVLTSDATGVTLRFTLPAYRLKTIDRPEGGFYLVESGGLGSSLGEEGKPALPAEAKLVGLPLGAVPHLTVTDEVFETVAGTDGREPEPVGRASFQQDGVGLSPTRTFFRDAALYDGRAAWPAASAELGPEGRWRYQRVLPVRIQPFRYEPATRTLRALRSAVVRVTFTPDSRRGVAIATRPDAFPAGSEPGPRTDAGAEGFYREALVNYEAARDFRIAPARPARTPARALGAANPEWAVRVDTTGVWRVTYAQLAARQFPAGIPTTELSLVRRDYAEDTNPPFVLVDIPLRVVEGATGVAGVFDGQDAIEFYGQSWTDRALPTWYRRRYSDSETLFLSWTTGGAPPRIAELSADRGLTGLPRPQSFTSFRRYERRFLYSAYPRDTCQTYITWTEPFADNTFTDTLTTFTPNPDPTGTVRFRSSFIGILPTPNQHTIWMRWKRPSDGLLTPVRTQSFNGQTESVYDTTFAADRIAAGTNKIEWRGYAFVSPDLPDGFSGASLSYYEVRYSRLYRAFHNLLDFNSSSADGDFELEVDGFTAATKPAVTVYDVSDSTAPRALLVPPASVRESSTGVWAATFQDAATVTAPRRYFAVLAAPTLPDAQITRANVENLWQGPGAPSFLIVTPDEFLPQAQRLAAHRRAQGHDVQVATMTAIAETFDGGRKTDWAIRRYFEFAFASWGTRLALLFGDGSDDARGEFGDSDRNWIPVHTIGGPVGVAQGNELSASDFWYVNDLTRESLYFPDCFSFEPDLYADISVGRLPAGSLTEATGLVDKLINYDTQDREGTWRKRVLLVPDDAYSTSSFTGIASQYCYKDPELVFETISDTLASVIFDAGGYRDMTVEKFSLREQLLPVGRPVPGCMGFGQNEGYQLTRQYMNSTTRPIFLLELGEGALVVNFQGHGSATQLAHEYLFNALGSNQDIDLVTNDGKPFFFLSYSCHVNNFATAHERSPFAAGGDALGENMVMGARGGLGAHPAAGAIGSYASTNYELLPSDPSGHNHINVWQFRSLFVNPPSDAYQGERGARVLLGEAMNLGAALTATNAFGLERRAVQTYCLLGDPATPLNVGAPKIYATANGDAVLPNTRYQPTAAGDSIVIDADLVDESRIDNLVIAITGEGARALTPGEITFTPTYPDTANGGAGRRYHIVWTFAPKPEDVDLTFTFEDRYGLANSFVLPIRLVAALYANGQRIDDGGVGPTSADYQFQITSPAQLDASDITLTVDGGPVSGLVVAAAAGDTTRRVWTLTWPAELEAGPHAAVVAFAGGATRSVSFTTSDVARVALHKVFAFPTPFANPPVTFNFTLDSDQLVDVLVKVYTVSGDLVWQRKETALGPGYHQLVWDGLDAQGDGLANGAYLYRVLAVDGRGIKAVGEGKLVRLR